MIRKSMILSIVALTTALTPAAFAASKAEQASSPAQNQTQQASASGAQQNDGQQNAMDRDFSKLSQDGFKAFRDIRMARLAIFDGQTDQAKTLVKNASDALNKAQNDETTFMKAEADMKQPGNMKAVRTGSADNASQAQNAQKAGKGQSEPKTQQSAASGESTEWLPIDGQISLAEGYSITPENSDAVQSANQSLQNGDRQQAVEQLKLAGIDLQYVLALAPLHQTVESVQTASSDIENGKYYEANLALKAIEDGVVLDMINVSDAPQQQQSSANQNDKHKDQAQQQHASNQSAATGDQKKAAN